MNLETYPRITTDNLILSKVLSTDIPSIVKYANNKLIADNTLNMPYPYFEKDAIFWINLANQGFESGDAYIFAIRLKDTEEFIGGVGLKLTKRFDRGELGYWLAESFWNHGYVTEAVGALIKFGFKEIGLNKIFANHLEENPASGKVMIKNGMVKEAELKDHYKKGNTYKSVVQYRITKLEYQNM